MRGRTGPRTLLPLFVVVVIAGSALTASMFAQEGHPLVGTWSGDWGPSATHRNQVTIVMNWDGKNVTGIVNPGPDVVPLRVVTLDSMKWTVHMEADAKDAKGNPVRFIVDGELDDILSYRRTLTGTWNHGNVKGDFKLIRD
jgi:hypothetical protein